MESFFVRLEGPKNVILAYREAFDYEAINKLSLPKKLQLRLFQTEKGVSFNLPEGTHVSTVLQCLLLSQPSLLNRSLHPFPPAPFPLNTGPLGNFPILAVVSKCAPFGATSHT